MTPTLILPWRRTRHASSRRTLAAALAAALWALAPAASAQTTTTTTAPAPAADRPACATADLTHILRNAASAKAAQKRLADEFDPLFAMTAPLSAARNEAEKRWLDATRDRKPAEELAALRTALDQAQADERTATGAVRQGLEQRKREELRTLLQRIETDYQRLGKEQGFRLLMQKGEKEPAYVLVAGSKPSDCKGEVDLSAQIIAAIDAPAVKP